MITKRSDGTTVSCSWRSGCPEAGRDSVPGTRGPCPRAGQQEERPSLSPDGTRGLPAPVFCRPAGQVACGSAARPPVPRSEGRPARAGGQAAGPPPGQEVGGWPDRAPSCPGRPGANVRHGVSRPVRRTNVIQLLTGASLLRFRMSHHPCPLPLFVPKLSVTECLVVQRCVCESISHGQNATWDSESRERHLESPSPLLQETGGN